MTDRIKGCYVAFDQDMRIDDAEYILSAIRMLKQVAAVEPLVADFDDWVARNRIRRESFDITAFVMRYMLTKDISYCFDRDKTITALQDMIAKLSEKK